jgi:alginate production protein
MRPSGRTLLPVLANALVAAAALALPSAPASAADWRALEPGRLVKVEGDWNDARGLVADQIGLRDGAGGDVEIIAPLQTVDAAGGAITALGLRIDVADAELRTAARSPLELAALSPGDWVEIDGVFTGGSLRVKRVTRLDAPASDVEVEGPVSSAAPASKHVEVAGIRVALGGDTEITGGGREALVQRAVDDDDATGSLWSAAGGRVRGGGRLEAALEPEDNFDLNARRAGDLTEAQWVGDFQVEARAHPDLDAFVKTGFTATRVLTDEEGDEADRFDWRFQQVYAVWQPGDDLALQLGRQDFDEPREWLYDENLDGARLHLRRGGLRAEASVSQRWNVDSRQLRDWTNWLLYLRAEIAPRWEVGAYALNRRNSADGAAEDPVWIGVRSNGRLSSPVRHWVDLALLRGTLDGIERDAWAADAGLRVRLARSLGPTVTVGFAAASGAVDEGRHFRQTGLHDNNDKFGGVTSFRYYGELVDPELSNLSVATAGLGFRPLPSSSIDLVAHAYAQRQAWPRLSDASVDMRPTGLSTDIGRELDLIVGFEEIPNLDVEYVFAVFRPGDAYPAAAADARLHKLQLKFRF